MKHSKIKILFASALFVLGTTHCAAQSSSLVPANLSSAKQTSFRAIASEIRNPCFEAELEGYETLEQVLDAGKTCHEAAILSSEISFFLSNDVDEMRIRGMIKAEARSMASPSEFSLEGRPRLGNASAPVEVVVFSDFQCPFCSRAAQTMHKAFEKRPDEVSFVFKQMPLTGIHPYAAAAALVSVYANSQGKFWEVHDKLFESQKELSPDKLVSILESVGGAQEDVFDPIKGQAYGVTVIEDIEDAKKAGVEGTPSFYVNGVAIEGGGNLERLLGRIDAELAAPPASSPEARRLARAKALETCPYPGHEEIYALLEPVGRADLSLYTNSVLCPCKGASQTLHDCAAEQTCPATKKIIDMLITRIQEKTPREEILSELEAVVQKERTKM